MEEARTLVKAILVAQLSNASGTSMSKLVLFHGEKGVLERHIQEFMHELAVLLIGSNR